MDDVQKQLILFPILIIILLIVIFYNAYRLDKSIKNMEKQNKKSIEERTNKNGK